MTTTLYLGQYTELRGDELTQFIFASGKRVAQVTSPFDPTRLLQGFGGALPLSQGSNQITLLETQWYLSDHLGGTSLLVDSTGQVVSEVAYYPFGLTRNEMNAGKVRYRFTDKELDASGTEYEEIDLALHPEAWAKVEELAGGERITPVAVEGDLVTVGFHGVG